MPETSVATGTQPTVEPVAPVSTGTPPAPAGQAAPVQSPQVDRFGELINKPVNEWNLTDKELKDPKFAESLENMRKERLMHEDYTRKTQELSQLKKNLWDPKARQFQDQDIYELLNNQTFVDRANSLLGQVGHQDPSQMTDDQKQVFELKQNFSQLQSTLQQQQQWAYQQQFKAELDRLDGRYSKQATPLKDQIEAFRFATLNPSTALSVEGAYKALNYDKDVKRAREEGIQEGIKGKQEKITNRPIGSHIVSSPLVKKDSVSKGYSAKTRKLMEQHMR